MVGGGGGGVGFDRNGAGFFASYSGIDSELTCLTVPLLGSNGIITSHSKSLKYSPNAGDDALDIHNVIIRGHCQFDV